MNKLSKIFGDEYSDSVIYRIVKHTNIYFLDSHRQIFWISFLFSCVIWLISVCFELFIHTTFSEGLLVDKDIPMPYAATSLFMHLSYSLVFVILIIFPLSYIFIKLIKVLSGQSFLQKIIAFAGYLVFNYLFFSWFLSWLNFITTKKFIELKAILSWIKNPLQIIDLTGGLTGYSPLIMFVILIGVSTIILYMILLLIFKLKLPHKALGFTFITLGVFIGIFTALAVYFVENDEEIKQSSRNVKSEFTDVQKRTSPLMKIKADIFD